MGLYPARCVVMKWAAISASWVGLMMVAYGSWTTLREHTWSWIILGAVLMSLATQMRKEV